MRDGTAIHRLIAERHGRQRHRLGWTEDADRREFEILREEVERAVRRHSDAAVEEVIALLMRYIEHAERISLRGWRLATTADSR
jgi:hypothetical protein